MLNPGAKLLAIAEQKQDELFQKMSAEEKIKLASDFYKLARTLQNSKPAHGTDVDKNWNKAKDF